MGIANAKVNTDHQWVKLPDHTIGVYNAWDTYTTALVHRTLRQKLAANYQLDFYEAEIRPMVSAILALAARGLPIDLAERTRLRRQFRSEVRRCDEVLAAAAGWPYVDPYIDPPKGPWFNPNSDTQVRRWLFGAAGEPVIVAKGVVVKGLGLKPAGKTDGGAWSVDLTNLVRVIRDLRKMDEPHRPILYALAHRSRFVKLDEYLDFEVDEDGRVRPTWKLHGTKSFRLAVSDPPFHSWAKELRTMVRAADGKLLVKADFSGVEARMAAYLSGDQLDIAVFGRDPAQRPYKHHPDYDIHSQMVMECFPELDEAMWAAMDEVARDLYRDITKTIRYGTLLYGGEPETAKTKLFCPCGESTEVVPWTACASKPSSLSLTDQRKRAIVDRWMAKHRSFVNWRNNLMRPFEGPHATHCLRMPITGWPVFFFQPFGPELQREVYNRPIQFAANILKLRAMRRLHDMGVPLIADHHDALYAEVCEGEAEATRAKMIAAMTVPVEELGGVVFPVDTAVGKDWASLH